MTTQQEYILAQKNKVSSLQRDTMNLCFFVYRMKKQTKNTRPIGNINQIQSDVIYYNLFYLTEM